MPKVNPLAIGRIETTEIGPPREADILYASIQRKLYEIAIGHADVELITNSCELSDEGFEPVHPPVTSARWTSSEKATNTETPRTTVDQILDPHVIGDWHIIHEAAPLSNGTPTFDHITLFMSRIIVERHAVDKEASGYYEGIVEGGIVYDSCLGEADMQRLRTLESALPEL